MRRMNADKKRMLFECVVGLPTESFKRLSCGGRCPPYKKHFFIRVVSALSVGLFFVNLLGVEDLLADDF